MNDQHKEDAFGSKTISSFRSKIKGWSIIGYVILAFGLGIALHGNEETFNGDQRRADRLRVILCEGIREEEGEALKSLTNNVVAELHISKPNLEKAIEEQLETKARRRWELRPNMSKNACTDPRRRIHE